MTIFLAGATGVLGTKLVPLLLAAGTRRIVAQSIAWTTSEASAATVDHLRSPSGTYTVVD